MRLVSPLLKKVVYPTLCYTGRLKQMAPATGCAVVNYHGVVPDRYTQPNPFLDRNLVSASTLRKQLKFLKANYEVVSPDDFRSWLHQSISLPSRAVLITCDDGLLNNLSCMLPVLQEEAVRCLFFVTGGSISETKTMLWYEELYHLLREAGPVADALFPGNTQQDQKPDFHTRWWRTVRAGSRLDATTREEALAVLRRRTRESTFRSCEDRSRLLNLHELRRLSNCGMTIGAHTVSHPVLRECSDTEAMREIRECKTDLERALEHPLWAFAYPFGNRETMGDREVRLAEDAGFECAFINIEGGFAGLEKRFAFPRTHVTSQMNIAELEAHMTGLHAHLQRAVRGHSS